MLSKHANSGDEVTDISGEAGNILGNDQIDLASLCMRKVKDYELYKIAKCLGVRINDLFPDAVQSQIIDCAVSHK